MTQLVTKGLSKRYGDEGKGFLALKSVDLEIEKGDLVAVTGKSGAGKSTLLQLLALMDKPTSGAVEIDGVNAWKQSARKLNKMRNQVFGFVFQTFFLDPLNTVLENVMLPLQIAGIRGKKAKAMAMEALSLVDLAEKAKNRATDLSGGQKQRLCIARALVNNPSILFVDEGTGNLDSQNAEVVLSTIFKLNQTLGVTVVFVTHDQDIADRCRRQIVVSDGIIVSDTRTDTPAPPAPPMQFFGGVNR
jgi:putative ABC transport system ATP-binding protein